MGLMLSTHRRTCFCSSLLINWKWKRPEREILICFSKCGTTNLSYSPQDGDLTIPSVTHSLSPSFKSICVYWVSSISTGLCPMIWESQAHKIPSYSIPGSFVELSGYQLNGNDVCLFFLNKSWFYQEEFFWLKLMLRNFAHILLSSPRILFAMRVHF
jgi:hypothetical protein